MGIKRRDVIGGLGAIAGCKISGMVLAQDTPPVTWEDLEAVIGKVANVPKFTCGIIKPSDEGPFYNPSSMLRREITENSPGIPMRLRISLGGLTSPTDCVPLVGSVVDVWHADANGQYSNVGPGIQDEDTSGMTFLRGHQITDENGVVEFDTVVPGWEAIAAPEPMVFAVRATHIHLKIYHEWSVYDTQLYFPDDYLDGLYKDAEPYNTRNVIKVPGTEQELTRRRNTDDDLYNLSQSSPMRIEHTDKGLVAYASIGTLGVSRGKPSFHKR